MPNPAVFSKIQIELARYAPHWVPKLSNIICKLGKFLTGVLGVTLSGLYYCFFHVPIFKIGAISRFSPTQENVGGWSEKVDRWWYGLGIVEFEPNTHPSSN